MAERRILYSPGFGAGWTTWEHDPDVKRLMLAYEPIIAALDAGESVSESHPAVQRLVADCKAMGKEPPYLGGLDDLKVATVHGRVYISEYDGSESYVEEGEGDEWL